MRRVSLAARAGAQRGGQGGGGQGAQQAAAGRLKSVGHDVFSRVRFSGPAPGPASKRGVVVQHRFYGAVAQAQRQKIVNRLANRPEQVDEPNNNCSRKNHCRPRRNRAPRHKQIHVRHHKTFSWRKATPRIPATLG